MTCSLSDLNGLNQKTMATTLEAKSGRMKAATKSIAQTELNFRFQLSSLKDN
jgi:hypothetical protein